MTDKNFREESDSMGTLQVPKDALWGAQTQRAVQNFAISGLTMPKPFIHSLGLIKSCAAEVNNELGLLAADKAAAIVAAADRVAKGELDQHFPVDVFQTGSGTSSNMNANEVIARLASSESLTVHPNDHVNMGQSSNDVIPTAIHLSASIEIDQRLLPALTHLSEAIGRKSAELADTVKTGRTHLMDAMPLTFGQELSGWQQQINNGIARIESALPRINVLAQGGTAVGTGINVHPAFADKFVKTMSKRCNIEFTRSPNHFESLSSQDAAVEISGQLKTIAVSLLKIANDLRWMNSGPLAGIGEIELKALQPGSSIMPGKVNPVIPESVAQVAAQVIGNDATITAAGQSGNFQLNVMLPVIAYNLLQSIKLLANAAMALADLAIPDFRVNRDHIEETLQMNPVLITALNDRIGYDLGAAIAKRAYEQKRPIIEVAAEQTCLTRDELEHLLAPVNLAKPC